RTSIRQIYRRNGRIKTEILDKEQTLELCFVRRIVIWIFWINFMAKPLYDNDFYARHGDRSIESARIVAPLVMRLAAIKSVIDVGCGVGGWLQSFSENGVATIRGLDGNYVDRSKL